MLRNWGAPVRWLEAHCSEQMICWERLAELGLFALTKQQLLGDLRVSHSCLNGSYKNRSGESFSVAPDWPQTMIRYVQVRHEEERCWEASTALEQAAWRNC